MTKHGIPYGLPRFAIRHRGISVRPHLNGAVPGASDQTAPAVVKSHGRDLLGVVGVREHQALDARLNVPHGQHRVVRPRHHLPTTARVAYHLLPIKMLTRPSSYFSTRYESTLSPRLTDSTLPNCSIYPIFPKSMDMGECD